MNWQCDDGVCGHSVWIVGAGLNQKRDKPESQDPNQLNDELRALQRRMFEYVAVCEVVGCGVVW